LGHPLADLAYSCLPYNIDLPGGSLINKDTRGGTPHPPASPSPPSMRWLMCVRGSGIPSEEAFVKQYCERLNRGYPIAKWHFYVAFSAFRLAGITQGVYKRSLQGNASSAHAGIYGEVTKMLSDAAWSLVEAAEAQEKKQQQQQQQQHAASAMDQALFTRGGKDLHWPIDNPGGASRVSTIEKITASLPEPQWQAVSERSVALQKRLWQFLTQHLFPVERQIHREINTQGDRWKVTHACVLLNLPLLTLFRFHRSSRSSRPRPSKKVSGISSCPARSLAELD